MIIAKDHINRLNPYQPGKSIADLQRELGVSNIIKLASNENPNGPSKRVLDAIAKYSKDINRYPESNGYELKRLICAQNNHVSPEQITLSNGSDELFTFVLRGFVGSDDEVIVSQYGFAAYAIAAKAVGTKLREIPAKNWGHDLTAMAAAVSDRTRVIFIANPNNPTGTWNNKDEVINLLDSIPSSVLVVVDQAYFEYLVSSDYPVLTDVLDKYSNLIITRTFSKAYGLSGLRIGYAISSSKIADILNRLRLPFNVNSLGIAAAIEALQDNDNLQAGLELNQAGMQYICSELDKLGLNYISSVANFVTIEVGDGLSVFESLLKHGIIVRDLVPYGINNFIRVSIGLESENKRFISSLKTVLKR